MGGRESSAQLPLTTHVAHTSALFRALCPSVGLSVLILTDFYGHVAGCPWVSGSEVSILPGVVPSIPISQMAKLRAQRRHCWLKDTGHGGTRVHASVLSLPCPRDHGILDPVLPEMLAKAQKNKLHPVPLKP